MSKYIQLHLLTSYPPSNVNRDDLGRPKTAVVGGYNRLRISSQSLKRAWRTSSVFEEVIAGEKGIRTKQIGIEILNALKEQGISEKKAAEIAQPIAGVFGKLVKAKEAKKAKDTGDSKDESGEKSNFTPEESSVLIEQLAFVTPEEKKAAIELALLHAKAGTQPAKQELQLLRNTTSAADVSLFGRMLASEPAYNIEAAAQVSHAFTVEAVEPESDYFTAVDDLQSASSSGSSHIGEREFGSGVFYTYICINADLLVSNLNGDKETAARAAEALAKAAATIAPGGYQNSFASRVYAHYMLAEVGAASPRAMSFAFTNPIRSTDILGTAIAQLEDYRGKIDAIYDSKCSKEASFNVVSGTGSLREVLATIREAIQ